MRRSPWRSTRARLIAPVWVVFAAHLASRSRVAPDGNPFKLLGRYREHPRGESRCVRRGVVGPRSNRARVRSVVRMSPATELGLPDQITACLFDLDGVLTDTARMHAAAWKEMFDDFLRAWAAKRNEPFTAFDARLEYGRFVDGKTRLEGTRSFLASRRIVLPAGMPDDGPGSETVYGLAERKNTILNKMVSEDGVEAYAGSVRYVRAVRSAGLRTAVVSSSANCAEVLEAADIADLFETRVDGQSVVEQHLAGKPAPDTFLAAARNLNTPPERAAVFEDALAGVEAGRAGGFGFVIGVDRVGQAAELRTHGADIVVTDLSQLLATP